MPQIPKAARFDPLSRRRVSDMNYKGTFMAAVTVIDTGQRISIRVYNVRYSAIADGPLWGGCGVIGR